MTSALLLGLVAAAAAPVSDSTPWFVDEAPVGSRPGKLGLGLALEGPHVGVIGGFGTDSRTGAGYFVGGALSVVVVPKLELRVSAGVAQTLQAQAQVSFLQSGDRVRYSVPSEWFSVEMTLGANYSFEPVAYVTPYLGADVGLLLVDGYEYRFVGDLEPLRADPEQPVLFDEGRRFGGAPNFLATLRAGVRLPMTDWLASVLELGINYVPLTRSSVTNALTGPDVRTVSDNVFLFKLTYAVRVSL